MLEKDPRRRPTAAEVDAALAELGGRTRKPGVPLPERHTVGRETELAELRAAFEAVAGGRGLLLCVAGEPGIGKTTLVEDFLAELAAGGVACTIARGQCSERLAGTEAYLPFLEALEALLQAESTARLMKLLAPARHAQITPVRSMIQRKIDQLSESDRRLLTAAGVRGHEFD